MDKIVDGMIISNHICPTCGNSVEEIKPDSADSVTWDLIEWFVHEFPDAPSFTDAQKHYINCELTDRIKSLPRTEDKSGADSSEQVARDAIAALFYCSENDSCCGDDVGPACRLYMESNAYCGETFNARLRSMGIRTD